MALHIPYILAYKSIFWVGKREFPEAPRVICASYFIPAEGKMFSAILGTQHYRIQPNKRQSRNKIVPSLPTNPLLFNKLQLIFTKLLFRSHKHAGLYIIILHSHALLPTRSSTSRCTVKQLINNTCQLKL